MDPNTVVKQDEPIQPAATPSPRVQRLKPTSIRKQRTLEDGHFHERKPLMSRTNYVDDSNITLSSFRSSSTNNLKDMRDDVICRKPISSLSMVKKKKKKQQKGNKDGNISSRDVDVRAITKFYMSNTSQKHKRGRETKNTHDNIDDNRVSATNSNAKKGKYLGIARQPHFRFLNSTNVALNYRFFIWCNIAEGTKNVLGQDEPCNTGCSDDICESNDTTKHTGSSSRRRERKLSISMIDLTNDIDDIACVHSGVEDKINGPSQTKSVEDIWSQQKKSRREIIHENYLKERLQNESLQFSRSNNQKELQGKYAIFCN